jgi:hypothetical protein
MTRRTPRALCAALTRYGPLRDEGPERFIGYGVMGLPFTLGHLLAFRRFTVSSVGPPYTAIWHRDPVGRWTIYSDVAPQLSCPRYFGTALSRVVETRIELDWTGPDRLSLSAPEAHLEWAVKLEPTGGTRLISAAGRMLPRWIRSSHRVLGLAGPACGRVLDAGPLVLQGTAPNGQEFALLPERVWAVTASAAVVEGRDVGPIGPHVRTRRLGEFVLPGRGLFAMGEAMFERFDPGRHVPAPRSAGSRPRDPAESLAPLLGRTTRAS